MTLLPLIDNRLDTHSPGRSHRQCPRSIVQLELVHRHTANTAVQPTAVRQSPHSPVKPSHQAPQSKPLTHHAAVKSP